MATSSCPYPYIPLAEFANSSVGYLDGRFCGDTAGLQCCLPCPVIDYVYPDSFFTTIRRLQYTSPFSFAACAFLLISWIVLPPERSHRHYLSIGLITCVFLVSLALTLPLIHPPQECVDAITPADNTDPMCSATGSLFLVGGVGTCLWVLLRVLWLHLCVCWNRVPGRIYSVISTATGIGLPLILLGTTFAVSGFSYGIADTCFIYHKDSFAVFWGWLVGIACASVLVQFATTAYCMHVFIASHRMREKAWSGINSVLGSNNRHSASADEGRGDEKGITLPNRKRAQWKGIRKVLYLQWRAILLASCLVIESLYFCSMSWAAEAKEAAAASSPEALMFGECLVLNRGDKSKCLEYASFLTVSKNATLASIGVMALSGVQAFFFLCHPSMFVGWYLFFTHPRKFWRERFQKGPRGSSKWTSSSTARSPAEPFQLLRALKAPFSQPTAPSPTDSLKSTSISPPESRQPSSQASVLSEDLHERRQPQHQTISDVLQQGQAAHNAKNRISQEMGDMAHKMGLDVEVLSGIRAASTGQASHLSHLSQGSRTSRRSGSLNLDKPTPPRPSRSDENGGSPAVVAGVQVARPPPVPQHILDSGIADPEKLPLWVRTVPGTGPVMDLTGSKRGGLGCHPVDFSEVFGRRNGGDIESSDAKHEAI